MVMINVAIVKPYRDLPSSTPPCERFETQKSSSNLTPVYKEIKKLWEELEIFDEESIWEAVNMWF